MAAGVLKKIIRPHGKGAQTREALLQKAIKFVAKKGFQNTSLQSIADACRVSQATVLYHFRNKENLLLDMVHHIVSRNRQNVESRVRPNDSARERIEKHFAGNLAWAIEFPAETQVILLLYYYAAFNAAFAKFYLQIRTAARARIEELILAGQREMSIPPACDAAAVAEQLHDFLLGTLVNAIAVPADQKNLAELPVKWKHFLHFYFGD